MDTAPQWIIGILAFLLLTSFLKIFATLSILRFGLNLERSSFGVIMGVVSFALTLIVMEPHLQAVGGVDALLRSDTAELQAHAGKLRPFLERHTDPAVLERLRPNTSTPPAAADTVASASAPPTQMIGAFVLSELRAAFKLGVLLLIPFLVIDLLIANVLLALGAQQVPVVSIALPLKLLLFVAVDGWGLIASKVLNAYAS